jgi:hypothetical protein
MARRASIDESFWRFRIPQAGCVQSINWEKILSICCERAMAMKISLDLERMTIAEKLQAVEQIWEDIARNPEEVSSPDWHGELLEERDRRIERGESKYLDLEEAKRRIRKALDES